MSNQQTMGDYLAANQLPGPVTGQQDIFLPHSFKQLARMIAVAIEVSLARECLVKTIGFLGRLFQTRLYHLHPCRRACAGMTAGVRLTPE